MHMSPDCNLMAAGGADKTLTILGVDHKVMKLETPRVEAAGSIRSSVSPSINRKTPKYIFHISMNTHCIIAVWRLLHFLQP